MILFDNLPRLCREAAGHDRVLDVGGWFRPFNLATHVVDIEPYETRQTFHALDPDNEQRFTSETWIQIDACRDDWPFPDDYFDFCVCSHTLEDLPDPVTVCAQINRVSRAGYIEVPSKLREIFVKRRFARLRSLIGQPLEIGFPHHHWICDLGGDGIIFSPKDTAALQSSRAYVTRADLGRKLTQTEAGIGLWWTGSFGYSQAETDLQNIRREALTRIDRQQ